MKIRQGFVSNSSGSSFVCYGYETKEKDLSKDILIKLCEAFIDDKDVLNEATEKLNEEELELYEIFEYLEKGDLFVLYCGEEGRYYFGLGESCSSEEGGLGISSISLNGNKKLFNKLKKIFPTKKLGLYYGTYAS